MGFGSKIEELQLQAATLCLEHEKQLNEVKLKIAVEQLKKAEYETRLAKLALTVGEQQAAALGLKGLSC